ncbi:sulfatase [Verrucomicrobia bacterium]|jgi:arylsulfatase A-like enzyme|nr:sulfatase [Verrucomicrobiota bacterium]
MFSIICRIVMRLMLSWCCVGIWLDELKGQERPDVLMIIIDDLNDWISLLDADAPIKTPNLQRLADRGMLFSRAYCVSPACNPSRVATLTGLRPSTSGVYGNRSDWRQALPDRPTIMQRFQRAGYRVDGAGKVFHHHMNGAFHDEASFDAFQPMRPQMYPKQKLNRAPDYGSRNTDWGAWPPDEGDSIDVQTTDYCIQALDRRSTEQPLFLVCGIFKPHSPFFAPAAYHRSNELVLLPQRQEDDWHDLPSGALALMKGKKWFWNGMMEVDRAIPGSYSNFIRSYAACASFADAQIGRLLDALDASPRGEKTIVVLWSDHGFHLGEKDHIEKFALWEKSNHVPFIVVAPDVTAPGTRCDVPVDLSVIYPTLLELGGLESDDSCDGVSISSLLRGESEEASAMALMTYLRGNHAVRSERWRYIRYADGSEELYDHHSDPSEWKNLASDSKLSDVLAAHRDRIPKSEASPVGDLRRQ